MGQRKDGKGSVRKGVGAWGVLATMQHLMFFAEGGYHELRTGNFDEIVGTFVLSGVIQSLANLREAYDILTEVAPEMRDVANPYCNDFIIWNDFRDDAAHVADRLLREAIGTRHDARSFDATLGAGTTILDYVSYADEVVTGELNTQKMNLGCAVKRGRDFVEFCNDQVQRLTQAGKIPVPKGAER